jgi:hypothetical protein
MLLDSCFSITSSDIKEVESLPLLILIYKIMAPPIGFSLIPAQEGKEFLLV